MTAPKSDPLVVDPALQEKANKVFDAVWSQAEALKRAALRYDDRDADVNMMDEGEQAVLEIDSFVDCLEDLTRIVMATEMARFLGLPEPALDIFVAEALKTLVAEPKAPQKERKS